MFCKSEDLTSVLLANWQASAGAEQSSFLREGLIFFKSPHYPSAPPPQPPHTPHTQHGSLSKSNEKHCINAAFKPFSLEPGY